MGGGDPIRTWFLQYIGFIQHLILTAKHAIVVKTIKRQYERFAIAKIDAEPNDMTMAVLMKV